MPSQVVEQLRQQFYASLGITDATPVPEEQVPALIDAWEQFLYASAQRGGGYSPYQPAPPPRMFGSPVYVPPASRVQGQPGQRVNVGGGTYVVPPLPGSIVAAPRVGSTGTPGGPIVYQPPMVATQPAPMTNQPPRGSTTQGAPPPRR